MSRFLLSSTLNTRDLGGYPADGGKVTKFGAFLRSDLPSKVSEEDIEMLLSNNITTIIDLRNDEELKRRPCALKEHKRFEYHQCKIYGDGHLPESAEAVPASYFEMVDEQKTVLNIMRAFAKAKGGIFYHCTAGKDRTGVITALLLLLAGVSKSHILTDYIASGKYLERMLLEFSTSNNIDLNIITPKPEYMEKFLDVFEQKYNSVQEYFSLIGLTDGEILQVKMKLID